MVSHQYTDVVWAKRRILLQKNKEGVFCEYMAVLFLFQNAEGQAELHWPVINN